MRYSPDMMGNTKIQLSAEELELMQNSSVILTKNSLIDKIFSGFAGLGQRFEDELVRERSTFPQEVLHTRFKVSKGEKYKGLPYIMLDYPRIFSKEHVLAIRTLFWWGNYYSCTLQVKGKYLPRVINNLPVYFNSDPVTGRYIAFEGEEWNHDLQTGYLPLSSLSSNDVRNAVMNPTFFKITQKIELAQWETVEEKLAFYFHEFTEFLQV